MANMEMGDMQKKELILPEPPKYPHGLKICLGPEELKKLNWTDKPEINSEFYVTAVAEVVEVEMCEEKGDVEQYRVTLQIKELDLKKDKEEEEKKEKTASQIMYGE